MSVPLIYNRRRLPAEGEDLSDLGLDWLLRNLSPDSILHEAFSAAFASRWSLV